MKMHFCIVCIFITNESDSRNLGLLLDALPWFELPQISRSMSFLSVVVVVVQAVKKSFVTSQLLLDKGYSNNM